jgi:CMP-N,N'-diacetyllegionaminic acid synthase
MKILGFIPARSGSKGLKNKNMINFLGKPLIYQTLKTSKKLNVSDVFVSTDSKKILTYVKKFGIKFNYLRPKNLSTSKSQIIDAIFHGVDWLKKNNKNYDAVLVLQPSNPNRNFRVINKAINLFKNKKIQSLISVSKAEEHPYKYFKLKKNSWEFLEKKLVKSHNRQDYPKNYFVEDGGIYLSRLNFLKKYKNFIIRKKTRLYKSSLKKVDIDTFEDLQIAKLFLK